MSSESPFVPPANIAQPRESATNAVSQKAKALKAAGVRQTPTLAATLLRVRRDGYAFTRPPRPTRIHGFGVPIVGRDHQQHTVHAQYPGEHIGQEPLVPRHIDEPDGDAVRQHRMREAKVDGHAAPLLLGEAVGVDAGQGAQERRLAVVDVTGGADDDAHALP